MISRRYFRYSLRTLVLASAVFAVAFGIIHARVQRQANAIETIQSHGGVVAYFDEWIVIGGTGMVERNLPPELSSRQFNWLINKPVREVQVDYQQYNDEFRDALSCLPTIERIHLIGHKTDSAVAELESDFPHIDIFDVEEFGRRLLRR